MGNYGFMAQGPGTAVQPIQPQGPGGLALQGLLNYRQSMQNEQAGYSMAQEAMSRLNALGTQSAQSLARLLAENPQAAHAAVGGDWQGAFSAMEQEATQAREAKILNYVMTNSGGDPQKMVNLGLQFGIKPEQLLELAEKQKKLQDPGTLKEIYDPNSPTGTTYQTRQGALGQPGKPPSGLNLEFDENGRVTGLSQGRRMPGDAAMQIGKKAIDTSQGKIVDLQGALSRLNYIGSKFNENYLTLPGQMKDFLNRSWNKAGLATSPETKKAIKDFTRFRVSVIKNMNQTIRDVTGAQMSEPEAKRIKGEIPNLDMGPAEFMAAWETVKEMVTEETFRHQYTLSKGLFPEGFDYKKVGESDALPVTAIEFEMAFDNRVDAILASDPSISEDAAVSQAMQELKSGALDGWE